MRSSWRRSIMTMSTPSRPFFMSWKTSTPRRSMPTGMRVGGPTTRTRAPHRVQQQDVRAGDAAVEDVAADGDAETFESALAAADRERVEKGLGRMFMRAVARIDDRAGDFLREKLDRARILVTNDDEVGVHRIQRHRRVDQGLALLHGGRTDRHVHDVGAEALAGQLEGALRARRGLEEEIDLGAAAQNIALLVDLTVLLDIGVGEVEKAGDVRR